MVLEILMTWEKEEETVGRWSKASTMEEEKYILHIALLGGSFIASQHWSYACREKCMWQCDCHDIERKSRSKDNPQAQKDLEEMGIRHELHLKNIDSDKPTMPLACFTMKRKEKDDFLRVFKYQMIMPQTSHNVSNFKSIRLLVWRVMIAMY